MDTVFPIPKAEWITHPPRTRQQIIQGRILQPNGKPLTNAVVQLEGSHIQTSTNEDGVFELSIGATPYSLVVISRDQANIMVYRGLNSLTPHLPMLNSLGDGNSAFDDICSYLTPDTLCPTHSKIYGVVDVNDHIVVSSQGSASGLLVRQFRMPHLRARIGQGEISLLVAKPSGGGFLSYGEGRINLLHNGRGRMDAIALQPVTTGEFEVVLPKTDVRVQLEAMLLIGDPTKKVLHGEIPLQITNNRIGFPILPTQKPSFVRLRLETNLSGQVSQTDHLIRITKDLSGSQLELPKPPPAMSLLPRHNASTDSDGTFSVLTTSRGTNVFFFVSDTSSIEIYTDLPHTKLPKLETLNLTGNIGWGAFHLPNLSLAQLAGLTGFGRQLLFHTPAPEAQVVMSAGQRVSILP
jgi:hypothetical protein